jgi:predicted DNA-binding transcriptional regulator YafY
MSEREWWSEPTSWEEICRRAAGRRHYNSIRQFRAAYRRMQVARLLNVKGGLTERGHQARVARELGVSRSTICRDVRELLRMSRRCSYCGGATAYYLPDAREVLEMGAPASVNVRQAGHVVAWWEGLTDEQRAAVRARIDESKATDYWD